MSTECERLAAVLCAIASDRDHARQDPIWAAEADDLRAAAALLRASSAEPREPERVTDLEENAWGLIANANEGNWEAALPEWKDAAIRWREAYHAKLRGPQADTAGEAELKAVRERDRLRKVLEPFAAMRFTGSVWENRPNADEVLLHHETGVAITLGHFRAARRALSESQPASPAGGET